MKKFFSVVLMTLLISISCYGLSTRFIEGEPNKVEVQGVVKEKFKKLIVANIMSHYESEVQYWVRLEDGRRIQLPAYLYKEVTKGEEISLIKPVRSPFFLTR